MCAYPHVLNDDIIDAIGTGVEYYWMKRKRKLMASYTTA
jgi:hypothetical protein